METAVFSREKVYTENNSVVKMILKRKLLAKLAQLKNKLWSDLHTLWTAVSYPMTVANTYTVPGTGMISQPKLFPKWHMLIFSSSSKHHQYNKMRI